MDLFGRYIFRQTTNALLMILGTLTVIVWITTSLKQIENLSDSGGIFLFIKMTTLAMPQAMAIVAPFALLIACLYSLHKLNHDSELIIMTASGAPVWRYIMPYLSLGAIVALLILISNLLVQPAAMQLLREYIIQVRTDLITHVLQSGKFSSAKNNITFHIRERADNGDLLGLLVHDERDSKQKLMYLAERGELIKYDNQAFLKMSNGHIHRRVSDKDGVQIIKFDEYIFNLSDFEKKNDGKRIYKPRERYLHELMRPDKHDLTRPKFLKHLNAEIHDRFSSVLYPLLFSFIAVATLGMARTIREKRTKLLLIGFVIALGLRMAGLSAVNLLKVNSSMYWLVYAIPLLGIMGCILYIFRQMSPQYFEWLNFKKATVFKDKNDGNWLKRT